MGSHQSQPMFVWLAPQDKDQKGGETKGIPEEQRRADPAYPATREDPRRAEG
jgi:hypothetical protein